MMTPEELRNLVRSIPGFPAPDIVFRDITTLVGHGEGFASAVALMADAARAAGAEVIAGIEARGFIFGAAVAMHLRLPFVPIRKPGKLPVPVLAMDYALEYGMDTLEIDPGAVAEGQRVVLVDDLLATGGTASAAVLLIRQAGASVEKALFLIELPDLGGRNRLDHLGVHTEALLDFPGH